MPLHKPAHSALGTKWTKAELGFIFAMGEWLLAWTKGKAKHLGETSLAHYLLFFHCQKKVSKKGLALRRFPHPLVPHSLKNPKLSLKNGLLLWIFLRLFRIVGARWNLQGAIKSGMALPWVCLCSHSERLLAWVDETTRLLGETSLAHYLLFWEIKKVSQKIFFTDKAPTR